MSKKSRKRNRRLLKAAALIGGLAMMGRRKGTAQGVSGSDKAKFTSDAAYTGDVTGTKYPGENKAVVADTAPKTNWISPRMRGNNPNDPTGAIGQGTRAAYAQKMRNRVTGVDAPPSILNPYAPPRVHRKRGQFLSTGGRVKGGGKAKRGLGRAFTKAKK